MVLKCFVVENLLSGLSDGVFTYKTSVLASVELASSLSAQKRNLNEYRLIEVGEFDNELGTISGNEHKIIAWDTRHCSQDVVTEEHRLSAEENQKQIDKLASVN